MMAEESSRSAQQSKFATVEDYLRSLNLQCSARPLSSEHLSRAVQLINKTNQFNLTGARTTEGELNSILTQDDFFVRTYFLSDRFGDYGLVSVAVLRADAGRLLVESWVMSCRVFERGVERKIEADFTALARTHGLSQIVGRHRPTEKNGRFRDLYEKLGYRRQTPGDSSDVLWIKEIP